MRRSRDAVHRALRAAPRDARSGAARRAASARAWRSSSATSRSSTPTCLMRGAAPTGARRLRRAAHRAVRRAVARPRRARRPRAPIPSRPRRIALYKSAKYTVERPLHLGAALAGRLDELGRAAHRDRAAARRTRSSCATTCSARSARPTSPASRSATTSARARRRRSSRSPPARAEPADQALLGRLGAADLGADEVAGAPGPLRPHRRAQGGRARDRAAWSATRAPRSRRGADHERRPAACSASSPTTSPGATTDP